MIQGCQAWRTRVAASAHRDRAARAVAVALLILGNGACATLHESSASPSDVVAPCIARKWERCAKSGVKLPVTLEGEAGSYFVGIAVAGLYTFPSGKEHPGYQVWVEVKDTEKGCETTYHRAYQFAHQCLDDAVEVCRTSGLP